MMLLNYLLFPIIFAITSGILFFVVSKKNKVWSNKKAIFMTLSVSVIISLLGLLSYFEFFQTVIGFIIYQFIFLGIGILAMLLWNKGQLELPQVSKTIWSGILFILINLFVGMIGFVLLYYCFNKNINLSFLFSLSSLTLAMPLLISSAYKGFLQIPNDIYNVWYYNVNDEVNVDNIDTDKVIMIEIEYHTNDQSVQLSNSRIKAPIELKFGDWFQLFIDYYNERTDVNQIEYLDEYGMQTGWLFFERSNSLFGNRRIDPSKTIIENKLTEKKVVVANRITNTETE